MSVYTLKPEPTFWQRVWRWFTETVPECRVEGCHNAAVNGICLSHRKPPTAKPGTDVVVQLPEFLLGGMCQKCGLSLREDTADVRYCGSACIQTRNGFVDGGRYSSKAPHIHHTCTRCGYEWLTQTKDAAERQQESANEAPEA